MENSNYHKNTCLENFVSQYYLVFNEYCSNFNKLSKNKNDFTISKQVGMSHEK